MDTQQINMCNKYYRAILDLDQSDNYILFKMADCFLKGYDLDKLKFMLNSTDRRHVSDAIFILGEIGDLTKNFIPELTEISLGKDEELASDAKRLINFYV